MGLKIFVSHARDLYGRGQPQGTCVLNRTLYKKSVLKLVTLLRIFLIHCCHLMGKSLSVRIVTLKSIKAVFNVS